MGINVAVRLFNFEASEMKTRLLTVYIDRGSCDSIELSHYLAERGAH